MKITIDVSEFYFEDADFESSFKEYVKTQAIQKVFSQIEKQVEQHLTKEIKEQVEKRMVQQMNAFITEFIKVGKVKSTEYSSAEMIPISQFITEKFAKDSGWSSPSETIKKLAKEFGEEMKKRYDMQFASHVVLKMEENGFLKEGIAQKIISGK